MINLDESRVQLYSLPVSDANNILVLAANTVESVTIPAGARYVLINASFVTAVKLDGDPPNVADTTDGSAGQLVQAGQSMLFEIKEAHTTVRCNATAASTVGISFYGSSRIL